MKKYFFFALCTIITFSANAQNSDAFNNYLEGAVPEVKGKVVFSKTIKTPSSTSESDLYQLMLNWAESTFVYDNEYELKSRVLLSDKENKSIVCSGEELLTFHKMPISWDKTIMKYQLVLRISDGICDVTIRNIKYDYEDEKNIPAEKLITDKYALNKKKDKLNFHFNKFRTHTINYVEDLFSSLEMSTKGKTTIAKDKNIATSEMPVKTSTTDGTELKGYKQVPVDKITDKLMNGWTIITGGGSEPRLITALWGGTSTLGDKKLAFSTLNTDTHTIDFFDNGDTYTISFYTEIYNDEVKKAGTNIGKSSLTPIRTPSGAIAFSEAWLIIECKKGTLQPSTVGSVADDNSIEGLSKEGYNKNYMGEIINVWVK